MPRLLPVHRIAFPVSVAGLAVLLWLALHADLTSAPSWPLGLALLGPGVIIGELTAVKVPRRGHYEEVTLSTAFTFALVISAGVLPAVAALVAASILQDVWARKVWWRITFNIGQYTLATAAAGGVLALLTPVPRVVGHVPFAAGDLPAIVLAAAAMFLVNFVIVSAAVAVHEHVNILDYTRRDFAFNAGCDIVLHSLSPIVVASMHFTPWLIPIFVLPLLGVALFGHQSAARVRHQALH